MTSPQQKKIKNKYSRNKYSIIISTNTYFITHILYVKFNWDWLSRLQVFAGSVDSLANHYHANLGTLNLGRTVYSHNAVHRFDVV